MPADLIVRADRAARFPIGGPAVREFAELEFPREDPLWVVASVRSPAEYAGGFRARWRRFWRSLGASDRDEPEPESMPDAGSA